MRRVVRTGGSDHEESGVLSVSLQTLYMAIGLLPSVALLLSIIISVLFYYDEANETECDGKNTTNYLPSVSAATGIAVPQVLLWRCSLGLLLGGHFLQIYLTYVHYSNFTPRNHSAYLIVVKMAVTAASLEKAGLVVATHVTSIEHLEVHCVAFGLHTGGAIIQMILCLILIKWSRDWIPLQGKMLTYYNHKFYAFVVNVTFMTVAMYCYNRHNTYCEDLVYTVFAVCEYLVTFSNIYFHTIDGVYLFSDKCLTLALPQPLQPRENHNKYI